MKHNFDIICSETYLDSSIQREDEILHLNGYKSARANNCNNNKRGGVGIYFKEFLATSQVELNNLNESIVLKFAFKIKKSYMISLYKSPIQTHDEFDNFLLSLEQFIFDIIARNPFFVLVTGNFDGRAPKCWRNDMTTIDGTKVDLITTSYGFSQIISDPIHILPNSSSCIDLIFTNQPNLVINSGVQPSLHLNYHHQIVFSKLNLKI